MAYSRRHQRPLILGFVAVILLLFGLCVVVLVRMADINLELASELGTQHEKAVQVAVMRDAMRKRQVGLRDMVIQDDPFIRDAAWQEYFESASEFIVARQRLRDAGLNEAEEASLARLSERTTQAYLTQQIVVDMTLEKTPRKDIIGLLGDAIEAQDLAAEEMATLIQLQRTAAQHAIANASNRYQTNLILLGIAVLFALLSGTFIAIASLKRDHATHLELDRYRGHLQELVSERTSQLERMMSEVESFSYSLAHDLRQPLRGLDGYSYMLLEDYADVLDDTGKHLLHRIRTGSQRIGHLLDGMLALTSLSNRSPKRTRINLADMAEEISRELDREHPGRRIEWRIDTDLWADADPDLMRIALENLLANSCKFTEGRDPAEIRFGSRREGAETVFFVQDNGAGFEMEYADKLFQPFQRLHGVEEFEGTGIGLATVSRIILRHNGRIWAEGTPGQGAIFHFTLE